MKRTTAVLDACVLVPISLCDIMLELADAGLFQPLWTKEILAETRKSLVEKTGVPTEKVERRMGYMVAAQPMAAVAGFESLIPSMGNHPKDRHVLAAAVHAGCPTIVTVNLADFPASALAPHGVEAVSPDEFLLRILRANRAATWTAIDHKRASYRVPPRTMDQVYDHFTMTVPRFAAELRRGDPA